MPTLLLLTVYLTKILLFQAIQFSQTVLIQVNPICIGTQFSSRLLSNFKKETKKMISQAESFLCSDKQETPEEGQMIQRLKCCVTTNNNEDEDNSPKNHTQNIAYQTSSQKFRQIIYIYIYIYILRIYPSPLPWSGHDTWSIFKQSTAGLNSEFSFSKISWPTKAKESSLPNNFTYYWRGILQAGCDIRSILSKL